MAVIVLVSFGKYPAALLVNDWGRAMRFLQKTESLNEADWVRVKVISEA